VTKPPFCGARFLPALLCVAAVEPVRPQESPAADRQVPRQSTAFTAEQESGERTSERLSGGGRALPLGRRLVIRFRDAAAVKFWLAEQQNPGRPILDARTYVVECATPLGARLQAEALALRGDVEWARPVTRPAIRRHFAYSAAPNDPYYPRQAHLDPAQPVNGAVDLAATINARGAWAITRGEGVLVGIGDDGLDLTHLDLLPNLTAPSRNFFTDSDSGAHMRSSYYHGTAVAGLIGARGDNGVGVSGVAPQAGLGALVIWNAADEILDDAGLAEMFAFRNDALAVQSHSWGNSDFLFLEMPAIQARAISNAVTAGRSGRGVVFVRSAGNMRTEDYNFANGVGDANIDAYANDLMHITVAAVRSDGRVASYSVTGACILVAAPGGEDTGGLAGLVTTDPRGTKGENRVVDPGDPTSADYLFGSKAFVGTSAAAPVVSGVVALVLAANPQLGWRDVQQILALTARQVDTTDPDLQVNGAGLRVSHNTGFGVVDAGAAARLAQRWHNRPATVHQTWLDTNSTVIPDQGFRVRVSGDGVPENLRNLPATGGTGRYPDLPTEEVPLIDAGAGDAGLPTLGEAGALLRRSGTPFNTKLNSATAAGAAFALIANNVGTTERVLMLDTDFTRIPAASIGLNDGAALRALVATNVTVHARLALDSAVRSFTVTEPLLVEHVRLRLRWDHPRQGDLRVTLRSPAGTLSVLHRPGTVDDPPLGGWTYGSTLHLGESSLGVWTLAVTDIGLAAGIAGTLHEVELQLDGVAISDADADGLDDDWERRWFAGLAAGPKDDPDADGWNNAAEQLQGSDPTRANDPFVPVISLLPNGVRVSWPATDSAAYELWSAPTAGGPWSPQSVPPKFPEGGLFRPAAESGAFYLKRTP
jgi:subtilisin-like proprotein convertase family protein